MRQIGDGEQRRLGRDVLAGGDIALEHGPARRRRQHQPLRRRALALEPRDLLRGNAEQSQALSRRRGAAGPGPGVRVRDSRTGHRGARHVVRLAGAAGLDQELVLGLIELGTVDREQRLPCGDGLPDLVDVEVLHPARDAELDAMDSRLVRGDEADQLEPRAERAPLDPRVTHADELGPLGGEVHRREPGTSPAAVVSAWRSAGIGSMSMPQIGHSPFRSDVWLGCIGQ